MFPDYLTFSVPVPVAERLLESLHSPWTSKRSLSTSYEEMRRCGGITVSMPADPNAAARIEVSGNGCRELEAAGAVTDWQAYLACLLREEAKFTRCDYALDDQVGLLCMDTIIACCKESRVVSRFREITFHPKVDANTGAEIGNGVSFGVRGSKTYIRIYDKAMQQGDSGHWIRVELETRKDKAHSLVQAIAQGSAQAVPPRLLSYLDFKVQGTAKKHNCWKSEPWWAGFLGTAERRSSGTAPRNVSLESQHGWLMKYTATTFALVHDSGMGKRLITEMLAHGRQKLRYSAAEAIIS